MTLLRDLEDRDLEVLFEHSTDPQAIRMAEFTAASHADRASFESRWAKVRSDDSVTTKVIEVDGEVVGTIASWENGGRREVTYWVGRQHWGKGIATSALRHFLHIERARPLYGVAAKDNRASIRVLAKCGFGVVGEGRAFANARGDEIDELILRLDR